MRKKKTSHENSERWLLTYSDLMNLLLILFIIFYSMSSVDQSKYEALSESLSSTLGNGSVVGKGTSVLDGKSGILSGGSPKQPTTNPQTTNTAEETKDETTDSKNSNDTGKTTGLTDKQAAALAAEQAAEQKAQQKEQLEMQALEKNISEIISKLHLQDDMDLVIQENGIVISFSNNLFFDSGKTVLKKKMKEGLSKIAVEIDKIDNDILIKGYTDNVPVKNSVYASNWQLSAIRAANVVQYLIEEGKVNQTRLSAMGCGENSPVATNKTEAGRSKNRRIEITILFKYKSVSK